MGSCSIGGEEAVAVGGTATVGTGVSFGAIDGTAVAVAAGTGVSGMGVGSKVGEGEREGSGVSIAGSTMAGIAVGVAATELHASEIASKAAPSAKETAR